MALGEALRKARLSRDLTVFQVAAGTRIKVQTIENIEREDFSQMAAPIYGKGFIRMYAEYVGLDPKPLIDEYLRSLANPRAPSLIPAEPDVVSARPRPRVPTSGREGMATAGVSLDDETKAAAGAVSWSFTPRPADEPAREPRTAPEPAPPPEEPDLFSPPKPRRDPLSSPEAVSGREERRRSFQAGVFFAGIGRSTARRLRQCADSLWRFLRRLRQRLPGRRWRSSPTVLTQSPVITWSVVLVILIVLIVVIQVWSSRRPRTTPEETAPAGVVTRQELKPAMSPPAPYVD